jgi:GNAT superfamily N-acetyltransferase
MQGATDILDADAAHSLALAEILADAFADDPVMNWIIPQPSLYHDFFQLLIRDIFRPRGIMHLEASQRGAALWLPPGASFTVPPSLAVVSLFTRLLLRRGPGPLLRIPVQGKVFERHHPNAPHYHLVFVGARRDSQGQGVGSALIKQGTRICDQQHLPAYLESSNEANVPLYQRHGFEVIAEETLPGGGPRAWFMWREPR